MVHTEKSLLDSICGYWMDVRNWRVGAFWLTYPIGLLTTCIFASKQDADFVGFDWTAWLLPAWMILAPILPIWFANRRERDARDSRYFGVMGMERKAKEPPADPPPPPPAIWFGVGPRPREGDDQK